MRYKNPNILFIGIFFVLVIFLCFISLTFLITKSVKIDTLNSKPHFTILSGSENKDLEPILNKFASDNNIDLKVNYLGSVDILQKLNDNNLQDINAVWPSSSVIFNLTDNKNIKNQQSIMKTPVVLGVKKSLAVKLGWTNKDIKVTDLLNAINNNSLKLAMTNPTQSNSGFSGYMSFLYAFSNNPNTLNLSDIDNSDVKLKTSQLLKGINKSSASSGWLKDFFVNNYELNDAMINYESVIIQANKELTSQNKEPLYIIYLKDGLVVSDSPLGYIDTNDKNNNQIFSNLQKYLLSSDVQKQLLDAGRRVGVGLNLVNYNKEVFNPDWGVKTEINYTTLKYPKKDVIEEMLNLYQISLRKPSFTVYVVDVSGSMEGDGISQLKASLTNLIDQDKAKKYYLQASPQDISILIPFNDSIISTQRFEGNSKDTLNKFMDAINHLEAGGGTNIYDPLNKAREIIRNEPNINQYFSSVIVMTDGMSNEGSINQLDSKKDISIFPIMFGDADPTQLKDIINKTTGELFDGRTDLINAFKNAKGYN